MSWWTLILVVALGLRVVAAVVVTRYAEAKGTPCVFGDTAIYWSLARAIVEGAPYVVMQWGTPHYALRTPGYPLFLAGCRELFGTNLLAVRLVQAVLGMLSVWLVGMLARSVVVCRVDSEDAGVAMYPPPQPSPARGEGARGSLRSPALVFLPPSPLAGEGWGGGRSGTITGSQWLIPLMASSLAAVHPYIVAMSALVLSEATFLPLMLLGLWGVASLWREPAPDHSRLVAIGTGLAMGAAILSRPSWALFVPVLLAAWVLGTSRGIRLQAAKNAVVVALATAVILAPWWVRNFQVIGRFVPTALWVGASLLDGIGPQANGSSDMAFVDAPDVRSLGESEQDATFRARSLTFAKAHPGRVLELALIKFRRFWSPWPNADTIQGVGVAAASAVVTLPVFALMALGIWDRRRDFRALVILAGPLAYFCVLHMVFVSSIRYRIPGEVPAMGLAAVGLGRVLAWARPTGSDRPPGRGGFDR